MKIVKKKENIKHLCIKLNVPRKTLDEWVKHILDDEKNKVGQGNTRYFNKEEVKKLWQIKELKEYNNLCRNHKYKNADIKRIINGNDPNFNEETFRRDYISLLESCREEYDKQIKYEKLLLEKGVLPKNFIVSDYNYDEIKELFLNLINVLEYININDEEFEKLISDKDLDILADTFERIDKLYKEKHSYNSAEIQAEINKVHNSVSKFTTKSVIIFSWFANCFLSDSEFAKEFELNQNEVEFLIQALKHYFNNCKGNEIDKVFENFDKNLYNLYLNKKKSCSDEVQSEIKKLYKIICEIPFLKNQPMAAMEVCKKMYFVQREEGVLIGEKIMFLNKFVSNAIEHFCKSFEMEE